MQISLFAGLAVATIMLVIALSVIMLIASFFRKQEANLAIQGLFKVYAYLIRFISLIGIAVGVALLLKPIFAYAAGYQFSYRLEPYFDRTVEVDGIKQPYPVYYPSNDTLEIEGQKYYTNLRERNQDLLNGATLTSFMAIVYLLHYFVSRKLDEAKTASVERKAYLFTGLIFFSIVSVIGIPGAIYQLINYATSDLNTTINTYGQTLPGEALAVAITVLPLWIAFILQLLSIYRKEQK
jgi:hypothetical protein